MPNRVPDQTMPGLPQMDVAGLAERITALREPNVLMVHTGPRTRDQSELPPTPIVHRQQPARMPAMAGTMDDKDRDRRGRAGGGTARRDIAQRRQYAAQRAVLALDRVSRTASQDDPEQWEQALRWMRLWTAFAASRQVTATAHSGKRSVRAA
jgi:hypothetical protein